MLTKQKKRLKMYVLVRKDLSETYRCVQGGHALAAYSYNGNNDLYDAWDNEYLIYLGVPNEAALKFWEMKLLDRNKDFECFREPDLGDQLTAISCIDTGEIFKDLSLA